MLPMPSSTYEILFNITENFLKCKLKRGHFYPSHCQLLKKNVWLASVCGRIISHLPAICLLKDLSWGKYLTGTCSVEAGPLLGMNCGWSKPACPSTPLLGIWFCHGQGMCFWPGWGQVWENGFLESSLAQRDQKWGHSRFGVGWTLSSRIWHLYS